jgi:hypothetical protein
MKKSLKSKAIYILVLLTLCGCSNPSTPATLPLIQQVKAPSTSNPVIDNTQKSTPSNSSFPSTPQSETAKSDTTSEWVYSKNKVVACRINDWQSSSLETNANFEFSNLKSEKPVNIIYTLLLKDKKGKQLRFFNSYTDIQSDIIGFNPPLKKGQSRIHEYVRKYAGMPVSIEMKACRVARKGETFWTINPEMVNYKGP